MIDFTNCKVNNFRGYGGKNGNKICVVYNNELYMLKFSARPKSPSELSYTNGCISEHIGSNIFNILGIQAQDTMLGIYRQNIKEKIVVACKDFVDGDYKLMLFGELKNACIESSKEGYGTELSEVMTAIEEQKLIEPLLLSDFFWDMFVVDAYIGNFDRHNGNWGILVNEKEGIAKIAPVYDCGSSLYPQLDEVQMKNIMETQEEIDRRIYVFPNSALKYNDKKINYYNLMTSGEIEECNQAIKRIAPRIDYMHNQILSLIDNQSEAFVSEIQKDFYKIMLTERKEKIIDVAYEMTISRELEKKQISIVKNMDYELE